MFLGHCGLRTGPAKAAANSCYLLHSRVFDGARMSCLADGAATSGQSVSQRRLGGSPNLGAQWHSLWKRAAGTGNGSGRGTLRSGGLKQRQGMTGGVGRAALTTAAGPASTMAGGETARPGPRVCILGGGFGGLYTAVRLDQLLWPRETKPQVTLIDQSDRFVFKPLLYDLVSGVAQPWEVAPAFTQLLAPYNINFVKGAVASVEADGILKDGGSATGGLITLADGQTVEYDWLVLALGAETTTFNIPGVKELALPFSTYNDAVKVMDKLTELKTRPTPVDVVIVGGGYAGVELAATVAEKLADQGRVKLITKTEDILGGKSFGQVQAARSVLRGRGVTIVPNAAVASMKEVDYIIHGEGDTGKQLVQLDVLGGIKQVLEADLVLWTAGSTPASKGEMKLKMPFELNTRGAAETDSTLRVRKHSRVFALGDVAGIDASPEDGSLPATAQVAFQQADYVAWNVWAAINGRPLLPFKYQHLGDMMSLGAINGSVSLPVSVPGGLANSLQSGPVADLLKLAGVNIGGADNGAGITLDGPLAGTLRRAAYLYRQPTDEHRLRVGAAWLEQIVKEGTEQAQKIGNQLMPGMSSKSL